MKYFAKKIFALIITLFIVSLLAFLAIQVIPGDWVSSKMGTSATPEQIEEMRESMGLNVPVLERYWDWLTAFLQGDFGTSYAYNMPVQDMIAQKLPITCMLVLMGLVLTILLSFPLGIFSARHEGGVFDRVITILNQVIMSIPPVFVGILLSYVFGTLLKLFINGRFVSYTQSVPDFLIYMIFPAISIALSRTAMTVKMLRSSLLGEMGQNYIRTAYSRGHSRDTALRRHALKNAIIPVIAFLGITAAEMVAGSIVIEQVFNVPGIGRLLLASIGSRDFPVVQAIVMILAAWVVIVNFIADLLSQYMDPRIRLG